MSVGVRWLRSIKQGRWIDSGVELGGAAAPADGLADLTTTSNCLSVYRVSGEGAGEDAAEQIAIALAARRDHIQDIGWVLVDDAEFARLGLNLRQSEGTTGDVEVNSWHFDVVDLTARRVAEIADAVQQSVLHGSTSKLRKRSVELRIREQLKSGRIERSGVSSSLLAKLTLPDDNPDS